MVACAWSAGFPAAASAVQYGLHGSDDATPTPSARRPRALAWPAPRPRLWRWASGGWCGRGRARRPTRCKRRWPTRWGAGVGASTSATGGNRRQRCKHGARGHGRQSGAQGAEALSCSLHWVRCPPLLRRPSTLHCTAPAPACLLDRWRTSRSLARTAGWTTWCAWPPACACAPPLLPAPRRRTLARGWTSMQVG